jgi:hypothetical protein
MRIGKIIYAIGKILMSGDGAIKRPIESGSMGLYKKMIAEI